MLWETIRLALRTIRRNVLRSFLTVLGVVIGVAAVIAMVTVGQGSSDSVTADIESLGSNVLMVRPGKQPMGPGMQDTAPAFALRDALLLAELPGVQAVAPIANASATVVYGNENLSTRIVGTSNGYLTVSNWTVSRGRPFTEAEERAGAGVCIIGETVREALFGSTDPTGETIRLKAISCTVVGLLESKGASSFGEDQDDIVLMPIRTVQRRLTGNDEVALMTVSLEKGTSVEKSIAAIEALMRERRRIRPGEEDDFSVTDMKQIASMLNGVTAVLTGLLSAVAAVSLLVGGIGIMNIMLVSVTERTREIGIRLAVGAQSGQVLLQFLVEAVMLSVLGGVIGIVLGLALALVGASVMDIPFSPDPMVVLMAFGFSALVGVVFGYFPARRAARLDPIEALRHQ
jgi:putative ABC transport system permease protein